jgi:signal transduction histidine kinase
MRELLERSPDRGGRRLATRTSGLLMLGGAALIAVTVALPPAAHGSDLLILGYGAVAAATGIAILARGPASELALGLVAALGTAVITLATLEAGQGRGAEDNQILYLWVSFYAFWFFGIRHALAQLALIGLGDALLLVDWESELAAGLTRWLVTMSTLLVTGLLLAWLRRTLERERDQAARTAVLAERMRIARELHDSAGHGMTAVSLQATAALRNVEADPDAARDALREIKRVSRSAMGDMRRLLGVLRADEPADEFERVSVAHIGELVDDAREVGIDAHLDVRGDRMPLPASVDQAGYRIVEEALSNVRRHAGPGATCVVTLIYGEDELELEVRDDGVGAPIEPTENGSGLVAIRERTETFGGRFEAAALPRGGFRIHVRIPTVAATAG